MMDGRSFEEDLSGDEIGSLQSEVDLLADEERCLFDHIGYFWVSLPEGSQDVLVLESGNEGIGNAAD